MCKPWFHQSIHISGLNIVVINNYICYIQELHWIFTWLPHLFQCSLTQLHLLTQFGHSLPQSIRFVLSLLHQKHRPGNLLLGKLLLQPLLRSSSFNEWHRFLRASHLFPRSRASKANLAALPSAFSARLRAAASLTCTSPTSPVKFIYKYCATFTHMWIFAISWSHEVPETRFILRPTSGKEPCSDEG